MKKAVQLSKLEKSFEQEKKAKQDIQAELDKVKK